MKVVVLAALLMVAQAPAIHAQALPAELAQLGIIAGMPYAKAKRLLDAGADVLKITDAEGMTVDEIRAVTAEAHARGKLVAAHGRTVAEIKIGLEGGVDAWPLKRLDPLTDRIKPDPATVATGGAGWVYS